MPSYHMCFALSEQSHFPVPNVSTIQPVSGTQGSTYCGVRKRDYCFSEYVMVWSAKNMIDTEAALSTERY